VSGSSNGTVSRTVVIPVGVDLHARPAGQLVRAAAAQGARVVLRSNGREAEAASILQVLALGATGGTEIVVEASGEAAGPAVEAIAALIASLA
jgi:phosphotransferase system HPr (HPr) family protein